MKKYMRLPSKAVLEELFVYDSETGRLTYKVKRWNKNAGDDVGWVNKSGYKMVDIKGKSYMVHRLCWMMYYGTDPGNIGIDHKDRNTLNNSIDNLRIATKQQNAFNTDACGFNKHPCGKYQARIMVDGKQKHLGMWDCPLMAHLAYKEAKRTLHAF